MDAETVDRLHTKNAKVHKIDPYNWVENLIGFLVGYDIILYYTTQSGKLLLQDTDNKQTLVKELQQMLRERRHTNFNKYQNKIFQLLRQLTNADNIKDIDALKLICDTIDEYIKIKEENMMMTNI